MIWFHLFIFLLSYYISRSTSKTFKSKTITKHIFAILSKILIVKIISCIIKIYITPKLSGKNVINMHELINTKYFKVGFFLIMAILLFFSFFEYVYQNQIRIEKNLKSITAERNQQTNIAITQKLNDEILILQAHASLIAKQEDITSNESLSKLNSLMKNEFLLRASITNSQGISYSSDRFQHDSIDRDYYLKGMAGHVTISNKAISRIDQKKVVFISVPIFKNDTVIGVLHATIDISKLSDYFQLSFLSGNAYSYIIQSDGEMLTTQESNENNFFTLLKNNHTNNNTIKQFKSKIDKKENGNIVLQLANNDQYMHFSHIDNTDWYILTILPYSIISNELSASFLNVILLAVKIGVILILCSSYILYLQKKDAKKITEMNKKLDAIIANTPGISYKHELNHPESITFFNHNRKQFAGYTYDEIMNIIKADFRTLILFEDYQTLQQNLNNSQVDTIVSTVYRIRDKNQKIKWIYDQRQIIKEDKKLMCYVEVLDITEMRQAQEQLKISEGRYELVLNETQSVIFEWNVDTDTISFSGCWTNKFGYPKIIDNFLVKTNDNFEGKQHTYIPLIESIISGKESDQIECIIPTADKKEIWVRIHAKAIFDHQGILLRIIGKITDINEDYQKTIELINQAQRDGLTQLYNRVTTETLINQRLEANPKKYHTLFVIDIDDFKQVNDTLGHTSGDECIFKISTAIKSCCRDNDIVGRIGGDEFVVFMEHSQKIDENKTKEKSLAIINALANIRLEENPTYQIGCSIGISRHPYNGCTYQELFIKADQSLYLAKQHGKNTFEIANSNDK